MKGWNQFNFEQREIISSMLSQPKVKLVEIANWLRCDPTSISKEIKRNRSVSKQAARNVTKECRHTLRYPYCCNHCKFKYTQCTMKQYRYDAKSANDRARYRLVSTRVGLNMSEEEFKLLDISIKTGIDNKESIYHIIKSNSNIKTSVPTVYRLINQGKLSTKRIDLPYAVSYKKRKSQIKQYEYKENSKIDRNSRTYIDYLVFKRNNPGLFHVEMDFLGAIVKDSKNILTITIPGIHFPLLFLIENKNAEKVASLFEHLESLLTSDFSKVFSYILTDRDPCFQNFSALEVNNTTGVLRTRIFYCDAFNSSQKASVENMNHQLRRFFPKGKSIDHLTQDEVTTINLIILNTRISSLCGASPKEAFIEIFGKTTFSKLFP